MARQREKNVGNHGLFELEPPASEREKFTLLRGCSPVLEIITIGIEDVSCFYCKDLRRVDGGLTIRWLGGQGGKAWECWRRGRFRWRGLEGVTKWALDFLRVD